ncbi:MAG: heme-binding protein [Gammaproteobacteria bacterium]|nr:heme-binding protein [Gammaproteobacteria bacterium]
MTNIIKGLLLTVVFAGSSALALEQPDYVVVGMADGNEIRRYSPYVVVEVEVSGSFKDAGNAAFEILAGYIFGGNGSGDAIAMAAAAEPRRVGAPRNLAVAAPVMTAASSEDQAYRYTFVMDKKYAYDDLPKPQDERIRLRQVEGHTVAARRYFGLWTQARHERSEAALMQALRDARIVLAGEPMLARYSAPFTPWFQRRNEVIVEIEWPVSAAIAATATLAASR